MIELANYIADTYLEMFSQWVIVGWLAAILVVGLARLAYSASEYIVWPWRRRDGDIR